MPVLTNLDERLQHAPFDADAYQRRLPEAQSVADRMPLVHVTGMVAKEEEWDVFVWIVTKPPHEIPTSEHTVYCSDETRRAEERLGLPRSVYFYAGRACPDFGNVALVFDADCQQGHSGSATPFDTGGFVWEPTPHIKVRLEPNDDLAQRVPYCEDSKYTLDEWRDAFAQILAAYFEKLEDYWKGRPLPADPEGVYKLNRSHTAWRCWTFEVRFEQPQSIHDRVAWCADEAAMHKLFRLYANEPNAPGEPQPIHRFLNEPPALKPMGTPTYCKTAETWVRGELGI